VAYVLHEFGERNGVTEVPKTESQISHMKRLVKALQLPEAYAKLDRWRASPQVSHFRIRGFA